MKLISCAVGALLIVAGSADPAAVTSSITETRAWLEDRIGQAPDGDDDDARRFAREVARRLERRLVDAGLDDSLAEAMTAGAPAAGAEGNGRDALRTIQTRLNRFVEASTRATPAARPEARQRLLEILEAPAFDVRVPEAGPVRRLMASIREWLASLFRGVGRFLGAASFLSVVLLVGLFCAAVAVSAWLVLRWVRIPRGPRLARHAEVQVLTEAKPSSPSGLIERSRAALAAGRPLESLKLVDRAAVAALREEGLVPTAPGLTDLEARRFLREGLRDSFGELLSIHDRGVFAGARVDTGEVERALELGETILLLAREEAA